MLRRGWGDGNAAAVALPPVPEAAGGLEPRFCLLFWSRFPWRRDLCKRHHLSWRHQGHLWVLGRPRPPPDPELSPCHQSQALVVPIIVTAGPWHPPCATVGILSPGHCPHHSLTATMPGLSPQPLSPPESSGGLRLACPHHGHSVPATGPTLSLSKPLCPHVAPVSPCHHGPPVPTAAIQAPPQPPHHSHAVPTQPRVCLSPWPLCPHKSHPLLTSATTATLCDTVTTVTLCSPQPPQPPCPHTVLVSPCHHSHSVLATIPATVVSLSPPQPSHPHLGHHSQSVPTQPLYPAATMDTLSPP